LTLSGKSITKNIALSSVLIFRARICKDWYHDQVPVLLNQVLNATNVQFRPPIPKAGLVNEANNKVSNTTLKFVPGKKYKIRVINMSALASVILAFESHTMKVVEIDGLDVEGADASQLYIAPAQRYSFILEAKESKEKNYAFSAIFDVNPNVRAPTAIFPFNTTGFIEYDSAKPVPSPFILKEWSFLDDFGLTVRGLSHV
jgi:iron transport multicopper oxidase